MANPPASSRFKPGQSGNPSGRSKFKLLTDALRAEATQNPTKVRAMAAAILEAASTGDLQAAAFIFDRLEGKPQQSIEIESTHVNLTIEQRLQRVIELQAKVLTDETPVEG
jgi:membrane carboxypeptidase/penicillin-binding protein PbpC